MTNRRPEIASWIGAKRPARDRLIGGVCTGLSQRFDVDVTLVRMAFLVLTLAWGLGLVVYGALWLLLPPSGMTRAQEAQRLRAAVRRGGRRLSVWPQPDARRSLAIGLIAGGALWMLTSVGAFAWVTTGRAIGLAAIAVGAGLLVSLGASKEGNRR